MTAPRVLVIAHNHPSLHPGGTEIFAHDLFGALKQQGAQALFLACTNHAHRPPKPGTNFQTIGRSADEVILWAGHFDRFFQSQIDLHGIVPDLTALLRSFRPDVVHIHHVLLLGVEMLFLIRRIVPEAKIVYTLHDYYPICANDGQMVTVRDRALCTAAGPDACHRCFPDRTPDQFVLREKHLKTLFGLVDRFLAPSRFLRDRYVAWGLAAERIEVVPNGRPAAAATPPRPGSADGRRDVFGYFGNLNPFKGVTVALDAAARLAEAGETGFSLRIHGGAPFQTDEFKVEVAAGLRACRGRASAHGAYRREEMADLLDRVDWVLVPSVWWENAPLVIQEAFQQGRPVICSNIGGMAEAVRDGVDGLHFRTGDAADLARVMVRAMSEPGLWGRLAANIPRVPTITQAATRHLALYRDLIMGSSTPALPGSLAR
ncbi:MAG TPA: glycosyltransferase family 4 protein [Arenibaculum sp.]|nr:glycosyltransferase family 4 protein [Arenibaculum sp.]